MAITYKGFSTVGRNKKFRLTDLELVRQDLINHFHIRKGEKLMNPNFGTIIWNVIYEPLTQELKDAISKDIKDIVQYDPRVKTDQIVVSEYSNGLIIQIGLTYIPTNQTSKLNLQFDAQNNTISSF